MSFNTNPQDFLTQNQWKMPSSSDQQQNQDMYQGFPAQFGSQQSQNPWGDFNQGTYQYPFPQGQYDPMLGNFETPLQDQTNSYAWSGFQKSDSPLQMFPSPPNTPVQVLGTSLPVTPTSLFSSPPSQMLSTSPNSPRSPMLLHNPSLPVTITLKDAGKWQELYSGVHEMMVTNLGRHITPRIKVTIGNANPMSKYEIGLKLKLQSHSTFQVKTDKATGVDNWREIVQRKRMVEEETIEIRYKGISGVKLLEEEQLLAAKIYNIGVEGKKGKNAKVEMKTPEMMKKAEEEDEKRATTMFRVVPQHKYIPLITVYEKNGLGGERIAAQISFPYTEFVVSTGYKGVHSSRIKTMDSKFTRSDVKRRTKDEAGIAKKMKCD